MRKLIWPLLALLLSSPAHAAKYSKPRVVMVIAGSSSIRDFADPTLAGFPPLFERGSAALLNVRAGRPSRDSEPGTKSGFESGCVSLGAGAMATAGAEASRAGNESDSLDGANIAGIFRERTGLSARKGQVLHLEIAKMQRINAAASYRARPGALGSALKAAGIRTAILGCSDVPGAIHREAVTSAMDANGVVDTGSADPKLFCERRSGVPYDCCAEAVCLSYFADHLVDTGEARFIVIDFGDTFRADQYAESCTDEQAIAIRHAADARLGRFAYQLSKTLDPKKDLLIVLSPNARGFSDLDGEKMGGILISGPGFSGGMLTSPSTRRPGVVTLSDVAPTVLAFFGIAPPPEIVGRPMQQTGHGSAAGSLLEMNERACLQAQRQPAMRGASVAQSVIVCLVMAAVLFVNAPVVRRIAAWLTLAVAALPLAMLYLPLIYGGGLVGTVVALVLLTIFILAVCSLIFRSPSRAFVWLCAAIVVSLMVDLLRGTPLMVASIASYNIVEGARYYGIGNELLGTMMGAVIVGMGMVLSAKRLAPRVGSLLLGLVFCAAFVFIAAPGLGAKVGGAIAMAPAMAAVVLSRRGWKPSLRSVATVLAVTILLVAGMFAADALRSGSDQSHAGRTVGLLTSGDVAGVLGIFARKLSLNFMLVATSVWSRLLGLCLVFSVILSWWGRRTRGEGFLDREDAAAVLGCGVGTAAAFIFNDSGVLAGATCSVFLWALLALRLLEGKNKCPGE